MSAGDLGSLHRFFPTFRREDRAAVEHTVGGCLRGGERQMGKLISLQHQVWKLMVRDWLGHFGGEYLILMFRVSHSVCIVKLEIKGWAVRKPREIKDSSIITFTTKQGFLMFFPPGDWQP